MAPKKSQSKKHRRRCSKSYRKRMMKGGSGAAEYAQSVYGGIGEQHAANNYSNVIAMRGGDAQPLAATSSMSPGLIGGGKRSKKGGNGLLTNLAVPAVLLIANQAMTKRRRSTSSKRRSHRRR